MGLDTTHNCWHGSYGTFHQWREAVAQAAGYGSLDQYEGFSGLRAGKPWPQNDALVTLLDHSDCDGSIVAKECAPLANRLEQLLPKLTGWGEQTQQFINGLRAAAEADEDVEFK
jgi:hypothetical protein